MEVDGSGIDVLEISDMVVDHLELNLQSNTKNTDAIIRDQADLVFNCMILIFLLFLVSYLPMLTDELVAVSGRMRHEVNHILDVNTLNQMASKMHPLLFAAGL